MNKQIERLANLAGLYGDKSPEDVPGFTACFEVFAELIVEECLDIIDEEGSHEGGSIRSMEKIQAHFGVDR